MSADLWTDVVRILKSAAPVWKDLTAGVQSLATALALGIGGWWTYRRFIRQQERYPNIEFSADINFIGIQGNSWLVELVATIENKGKAQHRMTAFEFDLFALDTDDALKSDARWGGQVDFPRLLIKGSFLPSQTKFFFVDPGTKAKYSFVTATPRESAFVILHCRFEYSDTRNYGHTAEKTAKVPAESPPT